MKKLLVVGVIVLFLGVAIAPSINADNERVNTALDNLPDLVIDRIRIKRSGQPGVFTNIFACRIKNIGETKVPGGEFYELTTIIKRVRFFGYLITDYLTFSGIRLVTNLPLNPGETFSLNIGCDFRDFPLFVFGFIQFCCTVNPDGRIKESNYDNNYREFTSFTLFSLWFPREG